MIVTTLAGPAAEPVGLAEAADYLLIAGDGEDGLVASLIAGARERIERLAEVAMISRALRVTMNGWPRGAVERRTVVLPVRPADELVAVSRDLGGAEGKVAIAAVRGALAAAAFAIEGWRCVLLTPLFSDATRERVGLLVRVAEAKGGG